MSLVPAKPSVGFRIAAKSGALVGPEILLREIDLLFRFAFIELSFETSGGLLIEADGEPWNGPDFFDTHENLVWWFESAAEIASGAADPVFVWAWEECRCYLTPLSGDLVQLEDRGFLPPVVFSRADLTTAFLAAGRDLLALQDAVHERIASILSGPWSDGVPEIALSWAREMPEDHFTERVVERKGPLVAVFGMSARDRWQRVLDTRMDPDCRSRLCDAVTVLGRHEDRTPRYPGATP